MVVGHNLKSGSKKGHSNKKDGRARNIQNQFSVNVTQLPLSSHGEYNIESEMEASGRRIILEQEKEDENHNQEVLSYKKEHLQDEEEAYNDEELEKASEPDEEVIVGTSIDDYEANLHPVTRSIFQQLSTSNVENVEETRGNSNHVQLYMPNAIRSCRMRRINYSPWGYDSPAHGDIINISQDTQRYRVQSDSASDYGGYKRKKKINVGAEKSASGDNFSHRLPSRPQSSCAITEIGVPERRWDGHEMNKYLTNVHQRKIKSYLRRNSLARTKASDPKVGNSSSKVNDSKSVNKKLEQKSPVIATSPFSRPQSITSSPTRYTPIANQLSMQRTSSDNSRSNNVTFDTAIPNSSSMTSELSSVGLMVSSMTLHQRPPSRNSKTSASAMSSRNNSRSGTPTRRRSSGYGQTPPRRNSKQENKTFWSGNEEFYFPDGTEDDLGKEEMEWISQAASIDEKFYLKSTPPPKVHVVLKKVGTVAAS